MKDKLKYRILIQWSDEDDCYLVSLPDLSTKQKWVSHGDTYQEALENGLELMEELIYIAEMDGRALPPVPELVIV
ncbi:MAG: type II toxin-antitoxin system HicB family antitoxin [Xenococcaceae cyanobacterium MO_188.B19]|nr:type II toxin-antitoxin system HicB family antitoxin [Xenococcaceae cyanobacterium MO_188.B19]